MTNQGSVVSGQQPAPLRDCRDLRPGMRIRNGNSDAVGTIVYSWPEANTVKVLWDDLPDKAIIYGDPINRKIIAEILTEEVPSDRP